MPVVPGVVRNSLDMFGTRVGGNVRFSRGIECVDLGCPRAKGLESFNQGQLVPSAPMRDGILSGPLFASLFHPSITLDLTNMVRTVTVVKYKSGETSSLFFS